MPAVVVPLYHLHRGDKMAEDLKKEVERLREDLGSAERKLAGHLEAATDSIKSVEASIFTASDEASKRAREAEWQETGRLRDLAAIAKARAGEADEETPCRLALAFERPGTVAGYLDCLQSSIRACPDLLGPPGHASFVSFTAARGAEGELRSAWASHGRWADLSDDEPFAEDRLGLFIPRPRDPSRDHLRRLLGRIEHLEALDVLGRLSDEDVQELDLLRWWNEARIAARSKMIANSKAALAPLQTEVASLRQQLDSKIETARQRWNDEQRRRAQTKTLLVVVAIICAIALVAILGTVIE